MTQELKIEALNMDDSVRWSFQAVDAETIKTHFIKIGDIPDDYYQAIGRIAVSFAVLESTVSSLCGLFVNDDQSVGQIVTSEFSFRRTLTMLSSLVRHRIKDENQVTAIYEVIKKAQKIEDVRNQVIHSVWGKGEDDDYITRFKTSTAMKRGLQHTFEKADLPYLHGIADDMLSIDNSFDQLFAPQLTMDEAKEIVKQQEKSS